MFNDLNGNTYDFYSIDKLTLYKKLYTKNVIPRIGYIYIGQRKNWRRIDLSTNEHNQIQIQDTDASDGFVDFVFDVTQFSISNPQLINLSREEENLLVKYQ